MKNRAWEQGIGILKVLCCIAWCFIGQASAEAVLILSSGSVNLDNQTQTVLRSHGHTVTIGLEYFNFTGAGLEGQDVVLLLVNANWAAGDMPLAGQNAIVSFVLNGGGLITSEWTVWKWAESDPQGTYAFLNSFVALGAIFPVMNTANYGNHTRIAYTQVAPDPILHTDVPPYFAFEADDFEGTETALEPKPGATVFYEASGSANGAGLVGWRVGYGHVLQFSTLLGPRELADSSYSRLVANAVSWAGNINLGPQVTEVRFGADSVRIGASLSATFLGKGITDGTYFDVRFRLPGSTTNQVAFNWQQGASASHEIPSGTVAGTWIVTGVRAHQERDDHNGDFDPVAATLFVLPWL